MQKAFIVRAPGYSGEVKDLNSHLEAGWRVVSCTPFHVAATAGGKSEIHLEPTPQMLVILERASS